MGGSGVPKRCPWGGSEAPWRAHLLTLPCAVPCAILIHVFCKKNVRIVGRLGVRDGGFVLVIIVFREHAAVNTL